MAGNRRDTKIPMMVMTTNSSTNVKPRTDLALMFTTPKKLEEKKKRDNKTKSYVQPYRE
jgi:hypothetical protein